MLFPTFFNLSLNFAIKSSWSEPCQLPVLFLLTVQSFSIFGCKEHNQSVLGIDHLVMSMCRVVSCVFGRGCLLWPVCSLDKTLLAFALLHFVLQGQTCLLLQVSLDFILLHSNPLWWNGNPLQYSCLENPMDRGAWRATVHGVTKTQTWLSHYNEKDIFFFCC